MMAAYSVFMALLLFAAGFVIMREVAVGSQVATANDVRSAAIGAVVFIAGFVILALCAIDARISEAERKWDKK